MKKSIRIAVAVIGACATLGTTQLFAQDQQMVQSLNIALTAYVQGDTTGDVFNVRTIKLSTSQIVTALGIATGNTFGSKARLVVITLVGGDGTPSFFVRDASGDTDVSSFFSSSLVGNPVQKSATRNGRTTGTQYSINSFSLGATDGSTTFSATLQGFTTSNLSTGTFTSSVNGPGVVDGADAVIKGTISTSAGKVEPVPTP